MSLLYIRICLLSCFNRPRLFTLPSFETLNYFRLSSFPLSILHRLQWHLRSKTESTGTTERGSLSSRAASWTHACHNGRLTSVFRSGDRCRGTSGAAAMKTGAVCYFDAPQTQHGRTTESVSPILALLAMLAVSIKANWASRNLFLKKF